MSDEAKPRFKVSAPGLFGYTVPFVFETDDLGEALAEFLGVVLRDGAKVTFRARAVKA